MTTSEALEPAPLPHRRGHRRHPRGEDGELRVLLIYRSAEPFRGLWSLPGGVLAPDQSLDEAATHKLRRETGVTDVYLRPLYTSATWTAAILLP